MKKHKSKPAAPAAPHPAAPVRKEPLGERLPYPGGFPVYLARYVLFGGETPRAAMRFFNASDVLVTGVRFRVTERDAKGRAIAEYPIERTGLFAERGGEFAVADIPVRLACTAIEVQVTSVLSDGYEYSVGEDGVRLQYGVSPLEKEVYFEQKATYSISKRKKRYTILAFVAVLAAVIAAVGVAWRLGVFKGISSRGEPQEEASWERTVC